MGRGQLAEPREWGEGSWQSLGRSQDHPGSWRLAFTLSAMSSLCGVTSRQEKDLVYIRDTVLVVFWTMGCRETRTKLEEVFRGYWSIRFQMGAVGYRRIVYKLERDRYV